MMAGRSTCQFVVKVGERRCRILSVGERRNGDLSVNIRIGPNDRDLKMPAREIGKVKQAVVREQKWSVHNSPDSQSNLIKMTRHLDNGYLDKTYKYTAAIKQTSRFEMLIAQRCSSLYGTFFDAGDDTERHIEMGDYDITNSTLVFQVFVGSASRVFNLAEQNDLQSVQQIFSKFSIVVLWSFLMLPAHKLDTAFVDDTPRFRKTSIGLNEPECLERFNSARFFFRSEMLRLIAQDMPGNFLPGFLSTVPYQKVSQPGAIYSAWLWAAGQPLFAWVKK